MATIRNLATGQLLDGPDGEPVPEGYERVDGAAPVKAAAAAAEEPGLVSRFVTQLGKEVGKDVKNLARVPRLMVGIDKPQSIEDVALLAMGNAPLIAASGGLSTLAHLPKLAPLARIAASFGLSKGRGEDTTTAAIEGMGAGVAEGALGIAGKALGGPAKALDAIRTRIGKGPDGPVNLQFLDKLVSWWRADPNAPVRAQRATVVARQLAGLDPSRESSRLFLDAVAKGPKMPITGRQLPPAPLGLSRVAEALTGPAGRSGADALMSADPLAPAAAAYGLTHLPESVMRLAR